MEANVVNRVRYIPVAEAAAGCMSICTNAGLNMRPGPMPAKVAKNAPKKATRESLIEF